MGENLASTHVLAELYHPPGALQGVVRGVVGLELERLQLGEGRAILLLLLRRHVSRRQRRPGCGGEERVGSPAANAIQDNK